LLKIEFKLIESLTNDQIIKNSANIEVLLSSYEVSFSNEKLYIIYANYTEDIYKKEISIRKTMNFNKPIAKYKFSDYLTEDLNMMKVLEKAKKIACNDSCVLIQGESGTGKEIIAQSIHYASSRKNYPFVPINFASIQPALLESELFGYEDGSFTGAKKGGKKGLLEMAHKGTIFFDEIGDAPLSSQISLLRVLQESEIRRVGGTDIIPIDVRVIVATNKNLWQKVIDGSFREDLFYRINVMPIDTIPLKERRKDLILIFNYYLKNKFNSDDVSLANLCTEELQSYLLDYSWPGNVREIVNICEYFACTKSTSKLNVLDLPKYILTNSVNNSIKISPAEKSVLGIIECEPKIGRGRLIEILKESEIELTDGKVRGILSSLSEKKLITVNKTKGGCEITELGKSHV